MILLFYVFIEVLLIIDLVASLKNPYILKESLTRFLFVIGVLINDNYIYGIYDISRVMIVIATVIFAWMIIGRKQYIKPVDIKNAFTKLEGLKNNNISNVRIELEEYSFTYYSFGLKPLVRISNKNDRKIIISVYRIPNFMETLQINKIIKNKLDTIELKKFSIINIIVNSIILLIWTWLIFNYFRELL